MMQVYPGADTYPVAHSHKLTVKHVTREILMFLSQLVPHEQGFGAGSDLDQLHVDFNFNKHDLNGPLEEFSQRYAKPAAFHLANLIGSRRLVSEYLKIPNGVIQATNERLHGIALRGVFDKVILHDFDGNAFEDPDMLLARFDVRCLKTH